MRVRTEREFSKIPLCNGARGDPVTPSPEQSKLAPERFLHERSVGGLAHITIVTLDRSL